MLTNNLIKGADSTAPATARRKRAAPILEGRILDAKGAGKVRHLARNRPLGSPSGKIACFSPTLGVASREDVLVDGDAGEEFGGWLAAEGFVADA